MSDKRITFSFIHYASKLPKISSDLLFWLPLNYPNPFETFYRTLKHVDLSVSHFSSADDGFEKIQNHNLAFKCQKQITGGDGF